jgi:hypothetical protein
MKSLYDALIEARVAVGEHLHNLEADFLSAAVRPKARADYGATRESLHAAARKTRQAWCSDIGPCTVAPTANIST